MNKIWRSGIYGVLIILTLAACQAPAAAPNGAAQGQPSGAGGAGGNGTRAAGNFQNNPAFQTRIASDPALQTQIASGQGFGGGGGGGFGGGRRTATPTEMPTIVDAPIATPTVPSPTAGAEQAVQSYFTALQSGDFNGASKLISAFSLMQAQTTAGTVAGQLAKAAQQGAAWSNLKIVDSQLFNQTTALIHVQYQLAGSAQPSGTPAVQPTKPAGTPAAGSATPAPGAASQKDEVWPVRLEAGRWLYNWNNIIDFETLNTPAQVFSGMTIDPLKVTRYSDHLTLTVLAQNATNDAIVIGQANQILATFHFGSQTVDSVNTQYIIDSLRSYANIEITVKGLYKTYPDTVDIVKFKNFPKQKPWFTFALAS
jgi:hypothetical protein